VREITLAARVAKKGAVGERKIVKGGVTNRPLEFSRHLSYFLRQLTEANMAEQKQQLMPQKQQPRQQQQLQQQPQVPIKGPQPGQESQRLRHIADLLGGPKVIGKYPASPLAAHEMLKRGLPNTAIKHLLGGMTTLAQNSIESAIGMSVRTRQRREKHPTEYLSQDQAGRTWKFAEILTIATSVFGSRTAAEQWLAQPATGLDQRRPIDLLTTPAGVELVEDFLGRIEYGVYT
jgi:putative toxin-antitoxin system antitoxin component (TIGR02293 family)